jgi:hypothetical protein
MLLMDRPYQQYKLSKQTTKNAYIPCPMAAVMPKTVGVGSFTGDGIGMPPGAGNPALGSSSETYDGGKIQIARIW